MQMAIGLAAVPAIAAGKSQTLIGEVSDAMCGGEARNCTGSARPDCTRGAAFKHKDRNMRSWSATKSTPSKPSDQTALGKG